ncbi:MAG: hypothetical protein I8H98_04350 [Moraxellaceae bacterium]|uniref:SPOR domain-containing protein n=1 Tax=Acinetobacter tjernbergiae DSM 14971 = CIP 107465 TaxID=1120928 RepID=V2W307_9GAMM|nr:hypothetical protein [Acinetobacter tjernbergiae]ESK54374.1 hypothetical protein F990_02733 [Acinetobacter tjernbergiae DSM 14971 = CIP 107465]MBH2001485.1 hypothetical protein [Moraxellaceae bacterium]MBH2029823.1 hypothetical protein [Moraxellaceae bacterium]
MLISRSILQNIQQYSWLTFAIVCLVAALIFWGITDNDALVEVEQPAKTEIQIQPEKVATTSHLGALSEEVQPLNLTTRVVVSNEHASEFRGTKFIKENQRQWIMEVFRSSDETIVKNFLLSRADRKKFFYFRLSGQDQAEQYVLAYGVFPNMEEVNRQFSQLNLILPQSVQPKPQQLSVYAEFVNDLGSDELKTAANQLYEVQLKPAALPKVDETLLMGAARPLKTAVGGNSAQMVVDPSTATQTTVTQRDAQGNVINVKQSRSTVQRVEKLEENSDSVKRIEGVPLN